MEELRPGNRIPERDTKFYYWGESIKNPHIAARLKVQTPDKYTKEPKHEEKTVTEEKTIEQKLKEQGIQVLDYDQKRDFDDIVKAYEQFEDTQLKFLHVDKRNEMLKVINSYFRSPILFYLAMIIARGLFYQQSFAFNIK